VAEPGAMWAARGSDGGGGVLHQVAAAVKSRG
jgi:hypothetical protein